MARPKIKGLLYFPFDIDFFEDNKIRIVKARYRSDGVMIYLFLLCEIYRQGYYIKADEDFLYIISDELGIDQNKVKQVLNFLLNKSLFDNTLFSSDKVLTSAGIQRRYQLGIKERMRKSKEPLEVGRYWLLKKEDTEPFIKCTLFEDIPGKCDSFSGKNESNSTEKFANKSKVNKSRCPAEVSASEMKLSTVSTEDDNDIGKKAEFILNEYTRLLPTLPAAQMSAKLMSNIITADRPVEDYTRVFTRASESSFLTKPGSGWKCGVEWLTEPANMAKVMSGKYDDYRSKTRGEQEPVTQVGGIESGFDTEDFFRAALRRGMKGAEQHGKPESP